MADYLLMLTTMRRSRTAAYVVGAVAGAIISVVAATVGILEAGLPVGGLSRNQAIAIADRQVYSEPGKQVRWAVPGPFGLFRDHATDAVSPPARLVWAVAFSGTFPPPSCGPFNPNGNPPHCPPPDHTETIILDYFTGQFIMGSLSP